MESGELKMAGSLIIQTTEALRSRRNTEISFLSASQCSLCLSGKYFFWP